MWLVIVVVRKYNYIVFLFITYPYNNYYTPLVSLLFLQQHPYFLFIKKKVFVLVIYIYIVMILHSSTVSGCILRLQLIVCSHATSSRNRPAAASNCN